MALCFAWLREMGGLFVAWATAQPGGDLKAVERALDEEVARFIAKGPTKKELERVKTQERASMIRGIEEIGGFGGKADILARSEVYLGSPDAYKQSIARINAATTGNVKKSAQRWRDWAFSMQDKAAAGEATDADLSRVLEARSKALGDDLDAGRGALAMLESVRVSSSLLGGATTGSANLVGIGKRLVARGLSKFRSRHVAFVRQLVNDARETADIRSHVKRIWGYDMTEADTRLFLGLNELATRL